MRFFVIAAVALVFSAPAVAGSCRYYSYGSHGATSCTGGFHELRGHGHTQRWGIRNGGISRYPGSDWPIYRTR
ncbi:hypothetical protein LG047_15325 [Methylocystis sp. WRRC1]|uniref:hypothetical protein n=1 Tax=Methylocystis sp. WRRC1 TaxID=1732014 RepID=UPI001D14F71A|nr:hypothetical protein [Methylocystis sp. WRRC1]MCC3246671.1 hypothetical protein [Methylocystis sp. WRRC1]